MIKTVKIISMFFVSLLTLNATEYDRYAAAGVGIVSYNEAGYSKALMYHFKLGLSPEEGFGMELEFGRTINRLDASTERIHIIRTAGYATYKKGLSEQYSFKARLGFADKSLKEVTTSSTESRADLSYSFGLNYEPETAKIFYLEYTVDQSRGVDLSVFSGGMQFFLNI